ncbi:MAG: transporter associated domain-containing protein, partial [Waddliaceae bacterium]
PAREKSRFILERTFSGEMMVEEFNREFGVVLDPDEKLTLSQLMSKKLGHHPEEGESIYIEPFELTAKETSLLEVKSIIIKTRTN